MSKKTLVETLKGGILLMILLLLMLMLVGGFLTWRWSKRARGPEVKVTINMPNDEPPAAADTSAEKVPADPDAWRDGGFPIPVGTVDVASPRAASRMDNTNIPAEMRAAILGAGMERMICRTFAPESDRSATVDACSYLMRTTEGAMLALSTFSAGPTNMKGLQGRMTPDGFRIAAGRRYIDVRRSGPSDGARQAALDFVASIPGAAQVGAASFAGGMLPETGMVQGSGRYVSAASIGLSDAEPLAAAEYGIGSFRMTVYARRSDDAASVAAGWKAEMLKAGGISQEISWLPRDVSVIQVHNQIFMTGATQDIAFVVNPVPNVQAAVKLAGMIDAARRAKK